MSQPSFGADDNNSGSESDEYLSDSTHSVHKIASTNK